jgi:hypothetical protein
MTASEESYKPHEHFRNLKGQSYLEVKHRVTWFRDEHADGYILTELVEHDAAAGMAMFKARAGWFTAEDREAFATGYGSETKGDFADYVEKAETKAIGRALACLGYGTAQAMDLDEGGSVADSPVERRPRQAQQQPARTQTPPARRPAPVIHEPTGQQQRPALRTANTATEEDYAAVTALLRADTEGAEKLPKPAGQMAPEELRKTRAWLEKRAAAIEKGQTTWVDPRKPLRPFPATAQTVQQSIDAAGDEERHLDPAELADLFGLIEGLLAEDADARGIYASKGQIVAQFDEQEAMREFAWLKERSERRARNQAAAV